MKIYLTSSCIAQNFKKQETVVISSPRPYSENYLGELLFEEHIDKETVKSVIYRMWIEREKLKIANT